MSLIEQSATFINYVDAFIQNLLPLSLSAALVDASRSALICVDILNGFCYEGNLASPRAAALVPAIARLFRAAHQRGVPSFVLIQEAHSEQAEEFHAFARHCVRGSREAQTVSELASLPFADQFIIFNKNSLDPALGNQLDEWLDARTLEAAIVTGVCTDLCVFTTAMHLRLRANERDQHLRVIVPADCVNTYDLPIHVAKQIGARPHDGDFLHALFLYQMALNQIEVVSALTA